MQSSLDRLTLVIGENGLDLARRAGLSPLLKVGNWLGPVLVAAAEAGVKDLLLLGYHGKLVKLAGGIFHTHHHLADGRLEVLTALGLDAGLSLEELRQLRSAASVEDAFQQLNPTTAMDLGRLAGGDGGATQPGLHRSLRRLALAHRGCSV